MPQEYRGERVEGEGLYLRVYVRGLKHIDRSREGTEGFQKRFQENTGIMRSIYLE